MATYWLSFVLDSRTIGGRDYDERRDALYDAIRSHASTYWIETTAFAVFESDYQIDQIAGAIVMAVAEQYDLVVVSQVDNKAARVIGPVQDRDIFKLIPNLETV